MSSTIIVPPRTPGAGRMFDRVWPDQALSGNVNSTRDRIATTSANIAVGVTGGSLLYKYDATCEADVAALISNGGTVKVLAANLLGSCFHLFTKKGSAPPRGTNDLACYRMLMTMYATGFPTPGLTTDFGFQIYNMGLNSIVRDGLWGWGLTLVDQNTVAFISRDTLGLLVTPITAAPFDTTKPHSYELRMQSATDKTEARLSLLIDGVPIVLPDSQSSWNPATRRLPPTNVSSGNGAVGWNCGFNNYSDQPCELRVMRFHASAAPTIQACL